MCVNIGDKFGDWEVKEKKVKDIYLCKCTCGLRKRLTSKELQEATNTKCEHEIPNRKDISGKIFGTWKVIRPDKGGYYLCECQCGCKETKLIYGTTLRNNKSKSCGKDTTAFKDLTNQEFGKWKAIEYVGNHYWRCECQCENKTTKIVHRYSLISGKSKSCGCETVNMIQNKLMEYGLKYASNRTSEQVEIVSSKEKMETFLRNLGYKATISELSDLLSLNRCSIGVYIRKYELESLVDIRPKTSNIEKEIVNFLIDELNISKSDIKQGDRNILDGQELDIYIESKELAIEVNGDYWHSTIYKDRNYHQNKTKACLDKGITLVHIFEHEWNDSEQKEKIKNLLRNKLNKDINKIYARKCKIKHIDVNESEIFLQENHLQGYTRASIRLGLIYENELVAIMTFDKPRFNVNYEYEMIRLAFKHGIKIIGGTERLFSYFINKYNPSSILSYCDISKFNGDIYEKLGFNLVGITSPNYIWLNIKTGDKLSRYKTTKQILSKLNISNLGDTEDEIMYNLNYLKIYDSGNKKFEWFKEEQERKQDGSNDTYNV